MLTSFSITHQNFSLFIFLLTEFIVFFNPITKLFEVHFPTVNIQCYFLFDNNYLGDENEVENKEK